MKFIQVTLVNDNQSVFIVKEHVVAFFKVPNQPSNEYCAIKTTGGHELVVKDTFKEVSSMMGVPSDVFFV